MFARATTAGPSGELVKKHTPTVFNLLSNFSFFFMSQIIVLLLLITFFLSEISNYSTLTIDGAHIKEWIT